MIKSFIIFVLTIALVAAALITRPSEQSARAFLTVGAQPVAEAPKTIGIAVKDAIFKSAEQAQQGLPPGYEFKDRILWVEVAKDGQTIYTGVLSHWVKNDPPVAPSGTVAAGSVVTTKAGR